MKIFLDMDGVCVDWMWEALKISLDVSLAEIEDRTTRRKHVDAILKYAITEGNWPKDGYTFTYPLEDGERHSIHNCKDPFSLTSPEFWDKLAQKGERWWYNLKETKHYRAMLALLNRHGKVYYLSSPPYGHTMCHAVAGKSNWLLHEKRHGPKFRDIIFTTHKETVAKDINCLLIDDSRTKCKEFVEAGGSAILFPQPWNGTPEYGTHKIIAYLTAAIVTQRYKDDEVITVDNIGIKF